VNDPTPTVLGTPLTRTNTGWKGEVFGFHVMLTHYPEGWATSVVGWGFSASKWQAPSAEVAAVHAEDAIRARAGEMRGLLEIVGAFATGNGADL
jgi:hypothetical protein